MSTKRRTRHSSFPKVNRDASEAPVAASAPEEPVADESSEKSVDLTSMTADEVVEWAGDDADRRVRAVAVESGRDKPRKTVLKLVDED